MSASNPTDKSRTSVVIPTYNRSGLVREAIDSVLAQTRAPLEIIVVDDGSTDDTQELVSSYGSRVTYVRQHNAGVSAARNTGIAAARGEYVALLDSDDVWDATHLAVTEAVLAAAPDAALVFTNYSELRQSGSREGPLEHKELFTLFRRWDLRLPDGLPDEAVVESDCGPLNYRSGRAAPLLFFGNFILCSTVNLRRSAIQAVGGFNVGWTYCEDWELFLRIARSWSVAYVDRATIGYRYHAAQTIGNLQACQVRELIVNVIERNADLLAQIPRPLRAKARRRLTRVYTDRALARLRVGDCAGARSDCRLAVEHRLLDTRAWMLGAAAFAPRPLVSAAASLRHLVHVRPHATH